MKTKDLKEELKNLIEKLNTNIDESGKAYIYSYPEDDEEGDRDWSSLHNDWENAIYSLMSIRDSLNDDILPKLNQAEVSHNTLFCVTRRYPRANTDNRYEIDKRVVQIEIETGKPLSDEFFNALTNLLSLYCG